MSNINQFEIQREIITIEEKLHAIREGFLDYAEESCEPAKLIDQVLEKTRELQAQMREWFGP